MVITFNSKELIEFANWRIKKYRLPKEFMLVVTTGMDLSVLARFFADHDVSTGEWVDELLRKPTPQKLFVAMRRGGLSVAWCKELSKELEKDEAEMLELSLQKIEWHIRWEYLEQATTDELREFIQECKFATKQF